MNNPIKYLYLIPAGIVICTILSVISSCSEDDNPPGGNLPAGKYPMTFTTSVGELVLTRGTVDNSWAGKEEVAIQLGNDAASYGEIKKHTAAASGELTPADNAAPLYWRNTTETVTAWYPYSTARPTSFTVQENQNTGDNYQASDFLYTTGTYTYNSSGACALVFKHLPVKVVINLTNGDQVTTDEVANATISIVNQPTTSGTITGDGTVAAATDGTESITPKVVSSDASAEDYQQTVQALLVPQEIAGKKLIKVTIGTGDTRDYYFTPATGTAALAAGTQYTYNITVMQEGLRVESLSATWNDNEQSMADPQEAEFKIYLSTLTAPEKSVAKVTDGTGVELPVSNGIYTTKSKTVNIVYTVDEGYELWNFAPEVKAGICKKPQQVTNSGNDYTYTLTDICTDIWLDDITTPITQQKEAAVGDYYYSDGTWSSTKDDNKTCIGIVFKVGAEDGDALTTYDGKIGTKIHGYVVALADALTTAGDWGTRSEAGTSPTGLKTLPMVGTDRNQPNTSSEGYGVPGYTNTKTVVENFQNNATEWANYNAFSSVVDYRSTVTAPSNSSGWYLPSLLQLTHVYNAIYDSNKQLTTMGTNLSTAGTSFITAENNGRYWSSNELSDRDAWYFVFSSGKPENYAKDGKNRNNASYARAILTF